MNDLRKCKWLQKIWFNYSIDNRLTNAHKSISEQYYYRIHQASPKQIQNRLPYFETVSASAWREIFE